MPNEPARPAHQPSIYQPLDPSREEIRLLTLHPSLKNDPTLRCTLRPAAFLSASSGALEPTPYEALSYVWGSPDTSSTILVNDTEFMITPNLTNILTSLRYATNSRTLWIDAICINQRDILERAEQVQLMHKVYSSCQRVLAWVEPPPGTSCRYPSDDKDWNRREPISNKQLIMTGMETLKNIANHGIPITKSLEQNYTQRHQHRHRANILRPQRRFFGHPDPSRLPQLTASTMQLKREHHALSLLLCDAPYWSRVWIVQELSRARKVTLIHGDAQLDWSCISSFLMDEPYFDAFHTINDGREGWMIEKAREEFREIFTKVKVIEDQRRTMHDPTFKSPNELLDVLTRFRDKESADPRDKIYALLGLVKGGHDIQIDYTKSLEVLYQEVTLSLINKSGTLDIICQNPFEHKKGPQALANYRGIDDAMVRQDRINLPSWAAHFASPSHDSTSILFAQRGVFSAGLQKINEICQTTGIKSNVLKVQGTVVGRLAPTEQDRVMQNINNKHGWFWGSMNHTRLYKSSDMYSAWEILQKMSCKESHDFPTQSNHALTVDVDTEKFVRRAEISMRAFWRTMARDCTAPPNMRRLTEEEIEELDRINTKRIQTAEPLLTCYPCDEFKASVLTYDPQPQRIDPNGSQQMQVSSPPEFQDLPRVGISSWPSPPTLEDFQVAEPPQPQKRRKLDLTRLPYAPKDYMFATTSEGLFVLTRRYVREGDFVAVLDGGKVPVILRRVPAQIGAEFEELYHFVCIAYVHGIMDGEVEEAVTRGWLEKREILLA